MSENSETIILADTNAPVQPAAEVAKAKKVKAEPKAERKPRASRTEKVVRTILTLPPPTGLDGGNNAPNLVAAVEKRYAEVSLIQRTGNKVVKAVVVHGEKAAVLGATKTFLYALVDSVLSGAGDGPDGSALYVATHYKKVSDYWNGRLEEYSLKVVPAEKARSGAAAYEASITMLVQHAISRAKIVTNSKALYGLASAASRTRTGVGSAVDMTKLTEL